MPWTEALIASKTEDSFDRQNEKGRQLSYIQAINEALMLAMDLDPKVFVLGQGVDDPKGMFGTTLGLKEKFGGARVFDTPLSEESLTGICTGAALTGMRPVYFHNRPDFLLLAFNQIVSHASKIHFMDLGKSKVPWVIWSAIGRGWGSGAQHSQAIQGLLLGVPGLKIVMPSTPFDAKGLMLASIADNNPVLIFEHRWLMKRKGHVPEGFYKVPLGKGLYRAKGNDLTILGTSHALELAIQAMDELDRVEADIIDLRTVKPLDKEIIFESVRKTGRVLIVDTGWAMGGVAAEIGCIITENVFKYLKAPLRRIGLPDIPTPAGYRLEQIYFPDKDDMVSAIKSLVDYQN